jgi:hypothetical protein
MSLFYDSMVTFPFSVYNLSIYHLVGNACLCVGAESVHEGALRLKHVTQLQPLRAH